jgi:hypothetical protein
VLIFDELKRRERVAYLPPARFVHAYAGLDNRDGALGAGARISKHWNICGPILCTTHSAMTLVLPTCLTVFFDLG